MTARHKLREPRCGSSLRGVEENGQRPMTHLRFVWTANGYELRERDGDAPGVGDEVDEGEERLRVTKVAPSPLPGDGRRCVYLQPLS
jgi:hypothetical protein